MGVFAQEVSLGFVEPYYEPSEGDKSLENLLCNHWLPGDLDGDATPESLSTPAGSAPRLSGPRAWGTESKEAP